MTIIYLMEVTLSFIVGWLCGSFINYIADTLPFTRRLGQPLCTQCQQTTSWSGYIFLNNHPCNHKRRLRDIIVQIITTITGLWLWHYRPEDLTVSGWSTAANYALSMLVAVYFIVVFVMDVEHRVVMHPVSIAGAILGFSAGLIISGWQSTLIGGAAGFGIMFTLYYLGELFIKIKAKRGGEPIDEVALGFGDVNLAGVLGLMLGWPAIWVGLLTAILIAGIVSLILILGMVLLKRYDAMTAIPYAPFLVLAAAWILFN